MNVELLDKAVASALCPMFSAIAPVSGTIAVAAPLAGPAGAAVSIRQPRSAGFQCSGQLLALPGTRNRTRGTDSRWWLLGNNRGRQRLHQDKGNPDNVILGYYQVVGKIIKVRAWRLTP